MNNKGLLIAVILAGLFIVAVKFQLFPKFDGKRVAKQAEQTESTSILRHEDGVEKDYFSNGNVRSETPYQNGLRNGVVKYYYSDGTLKSESTYVNDKLEGDSKPKPLIAIIPE